MRTKPFQFTGSQLVLNVDVKPGGMVKAALLDKHGQPFDGFDVHQCVAITGDHIAKTVSWNGKPDLRSLSGRLIRLNLKLADTDLYSFRFTDSRSE